MSVDLFAKSDEGLALILLRLPAEDLIRNCTLVSPQWNRILSESAFWRDKMDHDGYHLEWRKYKLAGLSAKSFKAMAARHCFGRNFIHDRFNWLEFDFGWRDDNGQPLTVGNVRIEIPPVFVDGEPEIPPGSEPIQACIGVHEQKFTKHMIIKLSDEGLTDEIMDKFRPTIVITEIIANRRDCDYEYEMICRLEANIDEEFADGNHYSAQGEIPDGQREYRHEQRDGNDRWIGATIMFGFAVGDAEGWHRVEHTFKDYPVGMRYLLLDCNAYGLEGNPPNQCGLKLANCSVKALFEKMRQNKAENI